MFKKLFFLSLVSAAGLWADRGLVVAMAIGDGYAQATAPGIDSKICYAAMHDYDVVIIRESYDLSRPIPWSKIPVLQEYLPQYDWVFFADADALITNGSIRIEDLIDDEHWFFAARDSGAWMSTGHFIIKNCPEAFELLEEAYAQTQFLYHGWYEQRAVIEVFQNNIELARGIKWLETRQINSAPPELGYWYQYTWQPGDFVLHFYGSGAQLDKLRYYFQKYGSYSCCVASN